MSRSSSTTLSASASSAAAPRAPSAALARSTRATIDLLNSLRSCGVGQDVAIPQVAVIGDQSSGKSSVLDAVVGVPLPRGAGLTTRCAIELRLSDTHPDDRGAAAPADGARADRGHFWVASIHTSVAPTPVELAGPQELEDALVARAQSLFETHSSGGFSRERVVVEMAATDYPNLTIVDLPGIIRTKTFGQDRGAIREVTDLIQSYITQDRTIMLIVVPATQDVATIEALEWAARVDPSGHRTIGVITKPDLIDDGAEHEVAAVLENKRKPLKLGYVMVKNRNQREVENRIASAEARQNERTFFANHKLFSTMNQAYFGVENLVKKLTSVLVSRVQASLPDMRSEIVELLNKSTVELEALGQGAGGTAAEANMTLMRIIFEYHSLLTESSAGRYVDKRLWPPSVRLYTRVRDLYDAFKTAVEATRPPFEGDSKFIDEVENDIRNSRGRELPGFLNPRIFDSRVARYVEEWRGPSSVLMTELRNLVTAVAKEILTSLATEFPLLRHAVTEIVTNVLKDLEKKTRSEVEAVFRREVGQPFTMNDQFLTAVNTKRLERFDQAVTLALSRAGRDGRGNVREKNVSDMLRAWYQSYYCSGGSHRLRAEAEDMATMLGCYWDVSAKRFIDNHVMVTDTNIIRPLAQAIRAPMNELVLKAGSSKEGLQNLLDEDPAVADRRRILSARVGRLKSAQELIDRF